VIKVRKPGLQTTVQDRGRIGYYHIGLPPSGAMDPFAYTVGNLLVGNDENAASLEITYMGPELEFGEDTFISVTGAEIPPKINGEPIPMWEAVKVKAGDVLSFGIVKGGARAYVAVAGGIDVPVKLGSRSTYTLCGIGGYEGRPLKTGDVLKIGGQQVRRAEPGTRVPEEYWPSFSPFSEIRVMMGLCSYRLTEESKRTFLETEWTVTPEANRVGYRFKGTRLHFVPREQPFGAGSNPSNVVDLGYPIGSIQVPDGIEPIALLNDAVTGGGYATIATVISADLAKVGQMKTNEKARFVPVTREEALAARREEQKRIAEVKERIVG
jgi:biotin-dependent carboxylase-like uncharacterized protein